MPEADAEVSSNQQADVLQAFLEEAMAEQVDGAAPYVPDAAEHGAPFPIALPSTPRLSPCRARHRCSRRSAERNLLDVSAKDQDFFDMPDLSEGLQCPPLEHLTGRECPSSGRP